MMKRRSEKQSVLKNLWAHFPEAAVLSPLIAIYMVIWLIWENTARTISNIWSNIMLCAIFGLAVSVVIGLIRTRKKISVLLGSIASACAIGMAALLLLVLKADVLTVALLIFAAVLVCLHLVAWKQPLQRPAQILGWFLISFGLSVAFGILLTCTISAVSALFFSGESYVIYEIAPIVTCFWFAPWLFLGGLPTPDAPEGMYGRLRKAMGLVLLPVVLLLIGSLLAYAVYILITGVYPSGVMNGYAMGAQLLFIGFRLMLTGDESRISAWFLKWGGWLLVPTILCQAVCVWTRVHAYGLTQSRIWGIALTLICIAAVIATLFHKRPSWFFIACAAVCVLFCIPPFSAQNLARLDQEARLTAALNQNGMLSEDGLIRFSEGASVSETDVTSIYSAVMWMYDSVELPEASLSASVKAQYKDAGSFTKLTGLSRPDSEDTVLYAIMGADGDELDVAGYSHISRYNEGFYNSNVDLKHFLVFSQHGTVWSGEDLLNRIDLNTEKFTQEEYPLSDGSVFRPTFANIRLGSDGSIEFVSLNGWILIP